MITKPCPRCSAALVVRRNGETGEEFVGCQNYPACTYTEPLPLDVQKRRRGDPMLPGFEPEPEREEKRRDRPD